MDKSPIDDSSLPLSFKSKYERANVMSAALEEAL
jgi:hypothetical protein